MKGKDPYIKFHELLPRYLAGELNGEELALFREVIREDARLKEELEDFRRLCQASGDLGSEREYDLDAEWGRMKQMLPGFGTDKSLKEKRPGLFYITRIAAVLLIGLVLGLGGFYIQRNMQTTVVTAGHEAHDFILEDGTKVLLNRESRLRYKTAFDGSYRLVKLSGEAWFEVAGDSLRPFVVEAGNAMVEVLGTSFNVNAYRQNRVVEVSVESGVVAVSSRENRADQIVLRAGNGGSYDPRMKELKLMQESDPNAMSWRTLELYFDNTPLGEVTALIGKVYNVEVELNTPELSSCPLTATFLGQDLESVLRVLALTMDLEVEREDRQILLVGEACTE